MTMRKTKSRINSNEVDYVNTLDDIHPIMLSGNKKSGNEKPAGWGTEIPDPATIMAESKSVRHAGHGQPAHRKKGGK